MGKIISKPYWFFFGLIPLLLIVGLIKRNEVIAVNVHDTYFVISTLHLSMVLSFLFVFSGLGYWIVLKLKKKLFKVLSFLHINIIFLGGVVLLITQMTPSNIITSNNSLLESLTTINLLQTIGVLLIIFGQVFYLFNILFSLIRNK